MVGWVRLGLGVVLLVVACGGKRQFGPGGAGSAGSEDADSEAGARAGSSGNAESGGMGATGAVPTEGGSAGAEGELASIPCDVDGARQCSGDVPQVCRAGAWASEAECPMRCTGQGRCVCMESMRRCDASTPQVCEGGEWVSQEPCAGATKACTGAGVCAAFKLRQGGLDAFGKRPTETPSHVLKQQSLSAAPRACGTKFCITAVVD